MKRVEDILGVATKDLAVWKSDKDNADFATIGDGRNVIAYYASAFPSIEAVELIDRGGFPCSSICCVCGCSPVSLTHAWPTDLWSSLNSRFSGPKKVHLPACSEHTSMQLRCVVEPKYWRSLYRMLTCITLNSKFATEFNRELEKGEVVPPWIAFPGAVPLLGWNQGVNSSWIRHWRRFWNELSSADKVDYIAKWDAPRDWSTYLREGGHG